MQKDMIATSAEHDMEIDEDLIDTLIAISVVAKRLAKKLTNRDKETKKCQTEKCMDCQDRQSQ
ncbi:MAG: hypothetical protein ACI4C4_01285 [Lachnospiraceae bacterium]